MRIAGAQTSPVWLDKQATTAKVVEWLARAHDEDADLVAFPETFLPGYPVWLSRTGGARFNDPDQKRAFAAYLEAAVELDGPELGEITEAVRDLGVFTYLGVAERGTGVARGTVYCTLVAISPTAGVVGAHRKLMPTYEERLVWGTGDGHGLRVHRVGGIGVGGLICWENWMPQTRHALYSDGEELHVSVWPGSVGLTRDITRFIALEGRVFSLAVGGLLSADDLPADHVFYDELAGGALEASYNGGTAVAAPTGEWLVEPVEGKEDLIVADIDAATVHAERQNFDPTGHYSRPDVFDVVVNRRRLEAATFDD